LILRAAAAPAGPRAVGGGAFGCAIRPTGVALPFNDGFVVVSRDGAVVALDAAGRRLWEALQAGCTVDDLIGACVAQGGIPRQAAQANISRAFRAWRALGLTEGSDQGAPAAPAATQVVARPNGRAPALDAVYQVGDRPVRVRCDDVVLGRLIDAACGSCRVGDAARALACVEVTRQADGLVVSAEETTLARTGEPTHDRALARHRCLTALLETARPGRRWLAILHASAVSTEGRCLVLAGAGGSGKSTLAAALVAAGADLVTDDYAPLEQASWRIWPVPYAPGIKRGSWRVLRRHFPELDARPVHRIGGRQIRYLDLDASRRAALDGGLPVEALVFPAFEKGAGLRTQRMAADQAFASLCHARSMLSRQPDVLAEALRWVGSVPAYRLVYGDLDRAVDSVLRLLRGA
jgi:hypothetical protein